MHIFEEQIIWQFQKAFFENLGISPKPPDPHFFCKKHPRKKMSESRLPLFFNFRGGLLSFIFSKKNHSQCLKLNFAILDFGLQKNAVLRDSEWFFEKMEKSRPPLKLKNSGGLLSAIFSKNHTQCLKSTIENQVSTFYTRVRTHFPNDCEQCYEVLGVTNGHYISQIDGKLLVERI